MTGDRFEKQDDHPHDEDTHSQLPPQAAREVEKDPMSIFDDDEFMLELDEIEDVTASSTDATPREQSADWLGLDGLFDRSNQGNDDAGSEDELDELFTAEGTSSGKPGFAGVKPAPDFVEDHAGWLGDDVDLASMVGEAAESGDTSGSSMSGFEDVEQDPFDLSEIEVEQVVAEGDLEAQVEFHEGHDYVVDDGSLGIAEAVTETGSRESDAFDFDLDLDATESGQPAEVALESDDAWQPLGAAGASNPLLSRDADTTDDAFDFETDPSTTEDAPSWAHTDFTLTDESADAAESGTVAPVFGRSDAALQPAWADAPQGAAYDDAATEEWSEQDVPTEEVDEVDPIYGDLREGEYAAAADDAWDADAARAEEAQEEFAETLAEAAPAQLRVVGAPKRGGSGWRRFAAAAAVLLTLGGIGVVFEPSWFGIDSDVTTIERVEVARPRIDINVPPPVVSDPGVKDPTPTPSTDRKDPPTTDPVDVDPTPVDPIPIVPTPSVKDPSPVVVQPTNPTPIGTDPVDTAPVTPTPPTPAPRSDLKPNFSPLAIGDSLEVLAPVDDGDAKSSGALPIGTRALALMRNDEVFVGVVRRMDADLVTLDLEPGEVSLALAGLSRIEPLATAGSDELTEAERGFVRLKNSTRFYGRILRDPESGSLIVQEDRQRIVLPKDQVSSFGSSGSSSTQVVLEGDDEWLNQRVREKLKQFGSGTKAATGTPGEELGPNPSVPPAAPSRR